MTFRPAKPDHWIVRMNYRNRAGSFALAFAAIGAHLHEQDAGRLAWVLLALQFLVYPHLVYWHARRAADPKRAELRAVLLDCGLFGAWVAALGTPQWQIDALKTFRMPPQLVEQYGYPEITDDIRAQIFGRNAARLYDVDADAVRCTVPGDLLMQAKAAYPDVAQPSLRQYGFKTRREFVKYAFTGRHPLG